MFSSTIMSVFWHGVQLYWLTSGGGRCSGLILSAIDLNANVAMLRSGGTAAPTMRRFATGASPLCQSKDR